MLGATSSREPRLLACGERDACDCEFRSKRRLFHCRKTCRLVLESSKINSLYCKEVEMHRTAPPVHKYVHVPVRPDMCPRQGCRNDPEFHQKCLKSFPLLPMHMQTTVDQPVRRLGDARQTPAESECASDQGCKWTNTTGTKGFVGGGEAFLGPFP